MTKNYCFLFLLLLLVVVVGFNKFVSSHRHQICPRGTRIQINYSLYCRDDNYQTKNSAEKRTLLPELPDSYMEGDSRCRMKPIQKCVPDETQSVKNYDLMATEKRIETEEEENPRGGQQNFPSFIDDDDLSAIGGRDSRIGGCDLKYEKICAENRDPKCIVKPVMMTSCSPESVKNNKNSNLRLNIRGGGPNIERNNNNNNAEAQSSVTRDEIQDSDCKKFELVKSCDTTDGQRCQFIDVCADNPVTDVIKDVINHNLEDRHRVTPLLNHDNREDPLKREEEEENYKRQHTPYITDESYISGNDWNDDDDDDDEPPVVSKSLDNFDWEDSSPEMGAMSRLLFINSLSMPQCNSANQDSIICQLDNCEAPNCRDENLESCQVTTHKNQMEVCHDVVNRKCSPVFVLNQEKLPSNCVNKEIETCDVRHVTRSVPKFSVPSCVTVPQIHCDYLLNSGEVYRNCTQIDKKICRNFDVLDMETEEIKNCRKEIVTSCFQESDRELMDCKETNDILCGTRMNTELVPSECFNENAPKCYSQCSKSNCKNICS